MQKRQMLFFLLAVSVAACSEQEAQNAALKSSEKMAAKYLGCDVEKTADLYFRDATEADVLRIKIKGEPCYEARLHISITTKDGKDLYQYQAPFKPHIAVHWEDIQVPKDPQAFIDLVLKGSTFKRGRDLPALESEEQFYEKYYNELPTDTGRYENLRLTEKPLFWHPTHYERWNYVVYDEKQGRGFVFMRGGL